MRVLAVLVVALAVFVVARPAQACMSVMWREHAKSEQTRLVAVLDTAQKDLAAHRNQKARDEAKQVLTNSRSAELSPSDLKRAHRIENEATRALKAEQAARPAAVQAQADARTNAGT